jgi:hypothetical protein
MVTRLDPLPPFDVLQISLPPSRKSGNDWMGTLFDGGAWEGDLAGKTRLARYPRRLDLGGLQVFEKWGGDRCLDLWVQKQVEEDYSRRRARHCGEHPLGRVDQSCVMHGIET